MSCSFGTLRPWDRVVRRTCSSADVGGRRPRTPSQSRPVPILFRAIDDEEDARPPACTYRADLVSVWLEEELPDSAIRAEWIGPQLDLQRGAYAFNEPGLSAAEIDRRVDAEVAAFTGAATIYSVRDVRQIPRLPIDRLVKASGGGRVSPDYSYGYAVCEDPFAG